MPVKAKARFRELLKSGPAPIGTFVSSTDAQTTDIMAAAGFDFVIIDREHGPHDNATALSHIRAAESRNIIPLIRVLENSKTMIQAALDLGAHGVIVPKIETAEQARSAVSAGLYAPRGFRGMCNACYAANYCSAEDWKAHQACSDENVVVIPIIETKAGVENIEEIVAVDGIDLVYFGPGDLSNDMGIDLHREPEKLAEAWKKVCQAVRARGKYVIGVGFAIFHDADIYVGTADLMMLLNAAKQHVASTRAAK